MPRIVYKTYYKCGSQDDAIVGLFGKEIDIKTNSYRFNGLLNSDGTYSSAPAWFFEYNFFPIGSCGWYFIPPNEANTFYRLSWTATNRDGTSTEYIVEIYMIDFCEVEINTPCGLADDKYIVWLNREGGWSLFKFRGKTTFSIDIPEASTYKNNDYILRGLERKNVYRGELVTTGDIPEASLELLESLKISIQAYLLENFNTDYPVIQRPIFLQDGDFVKRKTGDKRFDVSVKFIYPDEFKIQTG